MDFRFVCWVWLLQNMMIRALQSCGFVHRRGQTVVSVPVIRLVASYKTLFSLS